MNENLINVKIIVLNSTT